MIASPYQPLKWLRTRLSLGLDEQLIVLRLKQAADVAVGQRLFI